MPRGEEGEDDALAEGETREDDVKALMWKLLAIRQRLREPE